MRLTLRFDVFLVSESLTLSLTYSNAKLFQALGQSVNRQVGLRRRVEVRRCHGEVSYGWRSLPTGKHVWRPLPTSPVHAHRVTRVSSQDGRRGAPSARLTSRPAPLALRVSWYGSNTSPQAISGLGVSVKFRVMWFGLT